MAGSSRVPHSIEYGDHSRLLFHPPLPGAVLVEDHRYGPPPPPLPPHLHPHSRTIPSIIAAEERLAAQQRDIQALLLDNQRLAATHVALKQELEGAQLELRLAAASAARTQADREAELRALYDQSVRAEAEARAVEEMRNELAQVRVDVQKLGQARDELIERLRGLNAELARARAELADVPIIRAEIEALHHEIQRGRAAIEIEKGNRVSNLEQSQAMEKNMISMTHEVEKLRAELDKAEKRARAAAAAVAPVNQGQHYPGPNGNPQMVNGGSRYPDAYPMHQVQVVADAGYQYGPGAVPHSQYNIQQSHEQR